MRIAIPILTLVLGPLAGLSQGASEAPTEPGARSIQSGRGPAAQRGATPEVRVVGARPTSSAPAASVVLPPAAPDLGPAARRGAAAVRHDLARARALFSTADVDEDGTIDRAEARRAALGRRQFSTFDADSDGRVSADDFVVGYQALVAAAGRPVASDLVAEATRLSVLRRVRSGTLLPYDSGLASGQDGLERVERLRRRGGGAFSARGGAAELEGSGAGPVGGRFSRTARRPTDG